MVVKPRKPNTWIQQIRDWRSVIGFDHIPIKHIPKSQLLSVITLCMYVHHIYICMYIYIQVYLYSNMRNTCWKLTSWGRLRHCQWGLSIICPGLIDCGLSTSLQISLFNLFFLIKNIHVCFFPFSCHWFKSRSVHGCA